MIIFVDGLSPEMILSEDGTIHYERLTEEQVKALADNNEACSLKTSGHSPEANCRFFMLERLLGRETPFVKVGYLEEATSFILIPPTSGKPGYMQVHLIKDPVIG